MVQPSVSHADPTGHVVFRVCVYFVCLSTSISNLNYTINSQTAKKIWSPLCITFEPRGTSTKLFLLKKLLTLKYVESEETMENFLNRFDELHRKMRAAGCKIEDDMIACLRLSLPKSLIIVVKAIETLTDEKKT